MRSHRSALPITFDDTCSLLETALKGATRQRIVADVSTSKDLRAALVALRDGMRANAWKATGRAIDLERAVEQYDRLTRLDGFHVLHDWDGIADNVNDDTIPVDVLHYLIDKRGTEPPDPAALAILLDYYFFHLLALLALRIWDEGSADDNLDRLGRLLDELQGPNGSGQAFVANAETLILIATSHFELHERGYGRLLSNVKTLNGRHRLNVALGHTASMGSHLRFGFEATYARDTVSMRDDNVADYPWLCFALATVMHEYSRMRDAGVAPAERAPIVEGLLNGLSADARAFVGEPPASLSSCEIERAEFRDLVRRYRQDLLEEFDRHRPTDHAYSPLSFFFNFSHNVIKGTIVDALLRGEPWPVTFNDLLTEMSHTPEHAALKLTLATTLMGYARSNPSPIRGRMMPVIVYDPASGREAFTATMRKIRDS